MDNKKIKAAVLSQLMKAVNSSTDKGFLDAAPASAKGKVKSSTIKSVTQAYRTSLFNSIIDGRGSAGFEDYEYNMAEISQAEDAEGYVSISFDKHIDTCTKAPYKLLGSDEKAVDYLQDRLFEIFANTGVSTENLMHRIFRDIVRYSNCYLVFARDPEKTMGRTYHYGGKKLDPIAGIFIADPPSMNVKRNKNGKPMKYKQTVGHAGSTRNTLTTGYKTYTPDKVLHIAFNRKEGHAYGVPYIVPALEDIRSLRRIEEMVEMLVAGHIFPLYHYVVGTDEVPGAKEEVQEVKDQIEEMPTEGSLVTNERHKIDAIGAEGKALDAKPYLEYFEKRVLATLRISEITIGRGNTSNKNTADSLDKILMDRCSYYHRIVADSLESRLFIELMLDGQMPINRKSVVKLRFGELDEEKIRARENHAMGLYQANLITQEEARIELSREPLTLKDEENLHMNKVDLPQTEETAKIEKKYAPPVASPFGGGSSSGGGTAASKKTTKAKTQPTNQHGTKTTKTKVTANYFIRATTDEIDHLRKIFVDMPSGGYNKHYTEACLADSINRIIIRAIQYDTVVNGDNGLDQTERSSIIPEYVKDSIGTEASEIRNCLMEDKRGEANVWLGKMASNLGKISDRIDADHTETSDNLTEKE